MSLVLPANYGLVGAGLSSLIVLHFYQFAVISKHRNISGVHYPNLYASDAEAKADPKKHVFNCVQRAHQNTLENATFVVPLALFFGIYHPKLSAIFQACFAFGRYFYTTGYATGDPKARNGGLARVQYIGLLGLLFGTFYVGGQSVLALLK